jgi:hypothetical protein
MRRLALYLMLALVTGGAAAQELPGWDFTRAEDLRGWQATHHVGPLRTTAEGLQIEIRGSDPYINGPPRDFPLGLRLWMRLRLKSDEAGMGQVFYFRDEATEAESVFFPVRERAWQDVRVPLPPLGARFRIRFDPPGTRGSCRLASLAFTPRILLKEPEWPAPTRPALGPDAFSLQSGDLQLRHARGQLGGFTFSVAGQEMAAGFTRPLVGYLQEGKERWLSLADNAAVTALKAGEEILVQAVARDADGASWEIRQRFTLARLPGAIDVETQVWVSQDRSVIFLPLLVTLPGAGSFGAAKGQGLFAGLEYLENEPSSSEVDVIGPASRRQVPDSAKITFPLMALQAGGRYLGLIWDRSEPRFSALFDSPDRIFRSGGHVMGVLFPGSDGTNRVEGRLVSADGERLRAGQPLILRATLIGGRGETVIPAVQQYVALRGLPPLPRAGALQEYVSLAASGWLDSRIREGNRYRHAYWPGASWPPQKAVDAAVMMLWLARQTTDAPLARRLEDAARLAVAQAEPWTYNTAAIGHVHYPLGSLVFGQVAANTEEARNVARGQLQRFEPDGTLIYRPEPGGLDYGRTHFAPDANGLTAQAVAALLQWATVCGDPGLIREGLRVLRVLDGFRNTVPRGAQTWEVPLHTPDILASANLVRAYTLGYELTGEAPFLEQARYWAWTGVPFVYLTPPVPEPIGLYATTPVLGATNWTGPWFGVPVQWCGLVYADALHRFARYDPTGPWRQLADGITVSGIQQSWPRGVPDLQGLLPDAINLRYQIRNGVAINPGTVQAPAVRLFTGTPLYDFRAFRTAGGRAGLPLLVHAPGAIENEQEEPGRIAFTVRGWTEGPLPPADPYFVLISGLRSAPRVRVNGQETPLVAPHQYLETGRLILQVRGLAAIEIRS